MAVVFDYSAARFDPAALRAAGIVGVCRYLSQDDSTFNIAKQIRKPEYDQLLTGGIVVTLNWEVGKDSWQGGYSVGVIHGREARADARALGHPDERPIIVSVDSGAQLNMPQVAAEYVRGFNDGGGLGPQAVYAGTVVINECWNRGLIRFGWQAAALSWSPVPSTHVALQQLVTKSYPQFPPLSYDENLTHQPDWGQHPKPTRYYDIGD